MALVRLSEVDLSAYADFLDSNEPYSVRFRATIAESGMALPFWTDDPAAPGLLLQGGWGWFATLGAPARISRHLDDLRALSREGEGNDGLLKLSALPGAARDAVSARLPIVRETPCGLFTLREEDFRPPDGMNRTEPLREADAPLLAAYSEYGESEEYCRERIRRAPTAAVRIGGALASYMIVHANGSIGMLYTLEKYRNRGFGRVAAARLAEQQIARGRPVYCYIVDGNEPSVRVFESLGFRRAADVSWVVFDWGAGESAEEGPMNLSCGK